MRRRLLFAIGALVAAVFTFRVGAAMLGGTVWRFGSWEIVGRRTSLWEALQYVSQSRREARDDDEFWSLQADNITNAGILLLVAVGAGVAAYWAGMRRTRPDDRADYKEAPGGSVPDGRVGP
jgi:hypothetical protein